jgi:hypothetical protein
MPSIKNNGKVKFEDLGQDPGSFGDVELSEVERKITEWAGYFKIRVEAELQEANAINTGGLSDTIQWTDIKEEGGSVSVDIKAASYYKFPNYGVKGTQSGRSNNGYAFKNNKVGKSMASAIKEWARVEGIKAAAKEVKRSPINQERKGVGIQDPLNSLSYAIATNIKKKGIRPVGFIEKAADATSEKMQKELGQAFAIDLINNLVS